MTTFLTLTDQATRAIGGTNIGDAVHTWSKRSIQDWLKDAIRDYSSHFPRVVTATINCADDDRDYDLPADFKGVVSVEYPTGEDPPEYLNRRSYLHEDFWQDDGYYDVLRHLDSADVDELLISEKPATGETIELIYSADHTWALADTGTVTVPDRHHHVLIAYVLWQAWVFRLHQVGDQLSGAGEVQTKESSDARKGFYQAQMAYYTLLSQIKKSQAESGSVQWKMDDHDRIY